MIDFREPLMEILKFALGSAALAASFVWLSREIVKLVLSRNIEAYKNSLQAQTSTTLERIRADIREEELLRNRLHEKRAGILTEIYTLLVDAREAIDPFVKQMHWPEENIRREKYKDALQRVLTLRDYYKRNKLWLPQDVWDRIDHFLDEHTLGLLNRYTNILELQAVGLGKDWIPDELLRLWEQNEKEVPAALSLLESEFQKLLGLAKTSAQVQAGETA